MLEQAGATAAGRGLTNTAFTVGDVHALDFPDDTFSVVHAHQVLQHVGDPVRALREMMRVTRPGGFVAVRDADYAAMTWYPLSRAWTTGWTCTGGWPGPTAANRMPQAAEVLGADGRVHGHHRHLGHLDLLDRRGAGLVELPVGGPHGGVGLRRASHRAGPRHRRTTAGRRGGMAGVGHAGGRMVQRAARRNSLPQGCLKREFRVIRKAGG
ncbi:class I SAM-dependent methyltransferase [Streptomyces sp. INA 01156]